MEHADDIGCIDPQRRLDDSLVLALAWSFTRDGRYAERGSRILERLFIDPAARMDPFPGSGPDAGVAVAGMRGMYYYLDAVRIFESAGSIGESAKAGFRTWLDARLAWMSTSPGVAERRAGDHRGTCYDLQMASIASFLDDQTLVYGTLVRAQSRIRGQFAPDGRQPGELDGPAAADQCCFNFQTWINLAELASRWGVDLWGYRAPDGSSLGRGAHWLLANMGKPMPRGQADAFDAERLQPILFAAREFIEDLPANRKTESTPYAVKPVFPYRDGVRPFWNLASYGLPGIQRPPPASADARPV